MSSYYTKKEKLDYERSRRTQNMEQARNYRLMKSWLGKQHPDILNAYVTFKEDLQRQNPGRLDLTKAPMFREFMLKKRDPTQIPTEGKGGKTDQYGVPRSVHEGMRVALVPRSVHDAMRAAIEKSEQDRAKRKAAVMGENSDEKEEKRRRTTSTSSGENSNKDKGNTENKGTGQGTEAETEAHIIAMMDLMSTPTFRKFQQKDTP